MKRKVARISGLLLIILSLLAMMLPAVPVGAAAVPTVTGVSPSSGTYLGGTVVTLTGTNFNNANVTAVKFGGTAAASFTINSATKITAVTPSGTGVVNVTATNPSGTGTKASGFTYLSPPTVTNVSPAAGSVTGGTGVTITGTNFTGATAVKFGGIDATNFSASSATLITATAPAGSEGAVDVTVTTSIGTSAISSADQYTYVAANLVDMVILPNVQVLNIGDAFDVTVQARCGTQPVDGMDVYLNFDPAALEVTGATPGPSQGTILSPAAWDNGAGTFSFSAGTLTPPDPSGDFDVITIHFNVWSLPTQITFDPMTLVDMGGSEITGTLTGAAILPPLPPEPVIDGIDPVSGPTTGGTSVTIYGSSFTSVTDVSFGGDTAAFTVLDDNTIIATSPAHAAGDVSVSVTNPAATSFFDVFTYIAPTPYTIIFNTDGGLPTTADFTAEAGTPVPAPATPSKEGYDFNGWDPAVPSTMPASNLTCTAQWVIKPFTISFNSMGGSAVASITQNFGTAVAAPANPTKAGYIFNGWVPPVPNPMPAHDTPCVASWTAILYTVTFNTAGGLPTTADFTAEIGTPVPAPATPSKDGYTFNGWLPIVPATMPEGGETCVAQWTIVPPTLYTVTFDTAGGLPTTADFTAEAGTPVPVPATPSKEGYDFNGWDPAVPSTMPASNLTCTAQWVIKQFTISFNSMGGSAVASITQNFGTAVAAPANPTKAGYIFNGWVPAVPNPMPAHNTNCVASWTQLYTVTFDTAGGLPITADFTAELGTPVPAPATPSKSGFNFKGWLPEVPATMPEGGETCVAQWEPSPPTYGQITIVKNTLTIDGIFDFIGTGGNGLPASFSINANENKTFTEGSASEEGFTGSQTYNVAPGVYTITEDNIPSGWHLYSFKLNGVETKSQPSVPPFTVAEGQTVTIEYYNWNDGGLAWPVPELPAGMLLGTGIVGLGLFIMFRRMKTANVTN